MSAFIERVECEDGIEYARYDDAAPILGFQVAPFNWRLRRAREARGWSRAALARAAGVQATTVGDAEKLRRVPASSRWKMALALEVPEDLLFPGELDALPSDGPPTLELSMTRQDILERNLDDPHAELLAAGERAVLHEDLLEQLDTLTGRERRVLQLRYGLADGQVRTLDEAAEQFGITRERIRQIESRALRKLRHPLRTKRLRGYVERPHDPVRERPAAGACERYLERPDRAFCAQAFPLPGWIEEADEPRKPSFWCDACWTHWFDASLWPCEHQAGRPTKQRCFIALPAASPPGDVLMSGARRTSKRPAGWCDGCWAEYLDIHTQAAREG